MKFILEPVTRDRRGKFVDGFSYKTGDFYAQIGEALMDAHENAIWLDFLADRNADTRRLKDEAQYEILELIDLMTAAATRIKSLADEFGYNEKDLAEMQEELIERKRQLGYFDKPNS